MEGGEEMAEIISLILLLIAALVELIFEIEIVRESKIKLRFKNSWRLFAIFTVIGTGLISIDYHVPGWILIGIGVLVLLYSGFVKK